jgi:ABC-2 type transport system permease protein
MTAVLAGMRFQWWQVRTNFDELQTFVLAPLFTLIFCGIAVSGGRRDLLPATALGAGLVCMWVVCVQVGGNVIDRERWDGTFEPLVSTPAGLYRVVVGKVNIVVVMAALVLPEVWLVAYLAFGRAITVPHPGAFLAATALTLVGLHAAAVLVAGLFVLAREALIFQNALSYPVFLLGGLVVPVSLLPDWLEPLTRIVFLSWASDLLRLALMPAPIDGLAGRLWGLAITVVATAVAGHVVLVTVVNRARRRGTLSLA